MRLCFFFLPTEPNKNAVVFGTIGGDVPIDTLNQRDPQTQRRLLFSLKVVLLLELLE